MLHLDPGATALGELDDGSRIAGGFFQNLYTEERQERKVHFGRSALTLLNQLDHLEHQLLQLLLWLQHDQIVKLLGLQVESEAVRVIEIFVVANFTLQDQLADKLVKALFDLVASSTRFQEMLLYCFTGEPG